MIQEIYKKIKAQWDTSKTHIEVADVAFISLRIIVFVGGIAWLLFSAIPRDWTGGFRDLFIYFAAYSTAIYIWLFIFPKRKRVIYLLSLFLDLSFVSVLVNATGGFHSPFFNGFYLMTALYSFYYGCITGTAVAVISSLLYLISGNFDFSKLPLPDFSVKVSFLFLLALPLGMLSEKLKRDKDKIENLNKDLQQSIEALRSLQGRVVQAEKLSAIGRVTADIAHEIRNPLTSIGGFIRRLNKKLGQGTKEKEYTELVISEVERLERLLKDILTLSRETRFKLEPKDINEAVGESIQTFRGMFDEQLVRVKENLDISLPQILMDKDQVRQAVNNLISNAIDAMPQGGILTVNTFVQCLYEVNYIVVEVADTGSGIPQDKLNLIFEPFYSTKKIGVGTGLGLSICKKIIDEHNGLIRIESKLGAGTSIKLFFPYQSKEEEAKIKCWEFHKCGVEKAEGAAEMRCAAYPNYGRICWAVAGTFCGKRVSGAIAQKLGDCVKCEFYQRVVVRKDL